MNVCKWYVCLLVLVGVSLNGCAWDIEQIDFDKQADVNVYLYQENMIVNNETPIDELLAIDYPLQELQSFFGGYPYQQSHALFYDVERMECRGWEEANAVFPAECFRHFREAHYTVYKVREGGLFYVFWYIPDEGFLADLKEQEEEELHLKYSDASTYMVLYIADEPMQNPPENVIPGQTTLREILDANPSTEVDYWDSSGFTSYSLLDEQNVLVVEYSYDSATVGSELTSDEVVVTSIQTIEKSHVRCMLAAIPKADFPETFRSEGK